MAEVSVIIVCMNGPQEHLESCLQRLLVQTKSALQILVVAYMWSREDEERFAEDYPEVTLIPSREVRGFAENNNLALAHAEGRYCFVVNDDTRMEEPVIDALVKDLEKLPQEVAAISPAIRFKDGSLQTCGRGPWTAWRYARHYLHWVNEAKRSRWNKIRRRERKAGIPGKGRLFKTYTLNGACFLIKTELFKGVGGFDERFFFTPEDIALGHKLNALGYSVWADSRVSITHLVGGTVSTWEEAIKPARVRGSLIFYGEPFALKLFIWCVEACRWIKHSLKGGHTPEGASATYSATEGVCHPAAKRVARNVMKTVFSKATPKEIFLKFKP